MNVLKLTRRKMIALTVLVLVAVAISILLFAPFGRTIKDADRLRLGMSHSEVEAILGTPDRDAATGSPVWEVSDGDITVMMMGDRVSIVSVREYSRWDRVSDRIRVKLGLAVSPHSGRDRIVLVDW